ncbi:MAG: restriction endonuclease subunit S [Oscillospiraceae bacterium]|nr:restriction endonuclease subunit S [Oscillospiraceae bacterium]
MAKWQTVTLADVLTPKGYVRGPFGSALRRNELLSAGIPVYEQQHAIDGVRDFRFFVSDEKHQKMKRFETQTNDLIISCSGTVGKVSVISADDPRGIISQALLILRANTDVILPQYLQYFFTSAEGYNAIVSRSSGSVQVNIAKRAVIEQIPLNLPDIESQRAIVNILAALDDKIANNKKINHCLEEMAGAIFKSWFVDFEPWGRQQPHGWTRGKAEDFFDISIGKTPPRKEPKWFTTNPHDVIWVSISNMGSCGMYISDSSEYLTVESIEHFNVKVVPSGTVLLSFKLTVGRVAIADGDMATNEAIAHFKQPSHETLEYLYCYLKAFDYQSLGNTSSIATAVNSKTIKAMPFIMPDEKAIADFHAATAPLFEQARVNLQESTHLAALRDTLLPRLMSGELKV